MMTPTAKPLREYIDSVPDTLSTQRPTPAPPSVGTNIRQVVSAAIANNKTTVDFSGG